MLSPSLRPTERVSCRADSRVVLFDYLDAAWYVIRLVRILPMQLAWTPALLRRETRSLRPPSPEVVCCLACIMGESHDSGRVPGLDRIMDDGISSGASRTVKG